MQSLHPGPLPQQVDEWIMLQQQNCDDLMASAERTFKQLCAELDATKSALEAQQQQLPRPTAESVAQPATAPPLAPKPLAELPAQPPPAMPATEAPKPPRRPATYPALDERYPTIARVAAQRLQRLSDSSSQDSATCRAAEPIIAAGSVEEPPAPLPPRAAALLPSPLVMTALRHVLLRAGPLGVLVQ